MTKAKVPSKKAKACLISCSVLKDEIEQLIRTEELAATVVFVSKYFHIDYAQLEKNLRGAIQRTLLKAESKPLLVYGDLCLGPNGEMRQLVNEYGLAKVDALNCVDCLLGGKGHVEALDPNHELMFFDPGMVDFFKGAKQQLKREGLTDDALKQMFSGIKGIVLLDTLGNAEKCKAEIDELQTGLSILETKPVGLDGLKAILREAIKGNEQ